VNLAEFRKESRPVVIEAARDLIGARTENPPGNESEAALVVAEYLKRSGIRFSIFEKERGRANIVGFVGKKGESVLVPCHLDTVPAGEGWSGDPFQARVYRGRIYGRGASDNKGQMAALIAAATYLKKREADMDVRLVLAGLADEERGSKCGLEFLLSERRLQANFAVVPDVAHNMKLIDVAEKGAMFIEVTAAGRQAHGSTPEKGRNAVRGMMEFLRALDRAGVGKAKHKFLSPPTLNIGTIAGGTAPNMVPAKCTAGIDIRYLPGQNGGEIADRIRRLASRCASRLKGIRFSVKVTIDLPPTEVADDLPFIARLREHARRVTGRSPVIGGLSGATLVKQFAAAGIPAVGFGPGDEDEAHAADESISVKELVDFAAVIASFCLKQNGVEPWKRRRRRG